VRIMAIDFITKETKSTYQHRYRCLIPDVTPSELPPKKPPPPYRKDNDNDDDYDDVC
jgi:hypothetical protein